MARAADAMILAILTIAALIVGLEIVKLAIVDHALAHCCRSCAELMAIIPDGLHRAKHVHQAIKSHLTEKVGSEFKSMT